MNEYEEIIERIAIAEFPVAYPREQWDMMPDAVKKHYNILGYRRLIALRAAGLVVTLAKEEVE